MKTIFTIEHPELKVSMYRDAICAIYPEDDGMYGRADITMREVDSSSLSSMNGEEFYCEKMQVIEVPGARIKVNIETQGKLVHSELYGIRKYFENKANIYVNDNKYPLTNGFLY